MIHLVVLSFIIMVMGGVSIWHAISSQKVISNLIFNDMKAANAAYEMQSALANHKGFATYYSLDLNPKWLRELDNYRRGFDNWLETAFRMNNDPRQLELLNQIRIKNQAYISGKDEVLSLYSGPDRTLGEKKHWEVRDRFFELNGLVVLYKDLVEQKILEVSDSSSEKTVRSNYMVVFSLVASMLLLFVFGVLMVMHVIAPIRRLAAMTQTEETEGGEKSPKNELTTLGKGVSGLIREIDHSREELKHSKTLLVHSEKMAMIGNLATEVAHSIRNPMTSINMRLFSLQRNLEMTERQQEDMEVVAEEMRRLDNIVRNFLEFSRPHKLRKQVVELPRIVDMSIELLRYRLDLNGVTVIHEKVKSLSPVSADVELIKEVFVNLIINACEAMADGGKIIISEVEVIDDTIGPAVRVSFSDNGSGISEADKRLVMEPFYTTKPEGTGLGLFIAARIVNEHGGVLMLDATGGVGTTFAITLPVLKDG